MKLILCALHWIVLIVVVVSPVGFSALLLLVGFLWITLVRSSVISSSCFTSPIVFPHFFGGVVLVVDRRLCVFI